MKVKGNTIEYKGYTIIFEIRLFRDNRIEIEYVSSNQRRTWRNDNLEQAIAWIDEQGVKSE